MDPRHDVPQKMGSAQLDGAAYHSTAGKSRRPPFLPPSSPHDTDLHHYHRTKVKLHLQRTKVP